MKQFTKNETFLFAVAAGHKKSREPTRIDKAIDWKAVVHRYYVMKGKIDADADDNSAEPGEKDMVESEK